jgi:hypothetical protein
VNENRKNWIHDFFIQELEFAFGGKPRFVTLVKWIQSESVKVGTHRKSETRLFFAIQILALENFGNNSTVQPELMINISVMLLA